MTTQYVQFQPISNPSQNTTNFLPTSAQYISIQPSAYPTPYVNTVPVMLQTQYTGPSPTLPTTQNIKKTTYSIPYENYIQNLKGNKEYPLIPLPKLTETQLRDPHFVSNVPIYENDPRRIALYGGKRGNFDTGLEINRGYNNGTIDDNKEFVNSADEDDNYGALEENDQNNSDELEDGMNTLNSGKIQILDENNIAKYLLYGDFNYNSENVDDKSKQLESDIALLLRAGKYNK